VNSTEKGKSIIKQFYFASVFLKQNMCLCGITF